MIEMTMERPVKTRVWSHGKLSTNEAISHTMMLTTRKVSIPFSSFFCPIESFITQITSTMAFDYIDDAISSTDGILMMQ